MLGAGNTAQVDDVRPWLTHHAHVFRGVMTEHRRPFEGVVAVDRHGTPGTGGAHAYLTFGSAVRAGRVSKDGEQPTVEGRVRVQAAALVAGVPTVPVRESTACFLDQKDPRREIPDVVALCKECVDLAANKFDEGEGAGRRAILGRGQSRSGVSIQRVEPGIT